MKTCQLCDTAFEPTVSYQIYCSAECRELATKEKIAQKYIIARRNRMIGKKRHCKSCEKLLSAYNDGPICHTCSVNPNEVSKALKEIKGIVGDKPKRNKKHSE